MTPNFNTLVQPYRNGDSYRVDNPMQQLLVSPEGRFSRMADYFRNDEEEKEKQSKC